MGLIQFRNGMKLSEMEWMIRNEMDGMDGSRAYVRNGVRYRFVTDVGRPLINISLLKSK